MRHVDLRAASPAAAACHLRPFDPGTL